MVDLQDPGGSRRLWRAPRGRVALGLAVILSILALNLFRAVHLSVVHDEALTYNYFVPLSWRSIGWALYSNNHTLHTMLVKASTGIFGLSSLSLRLPALLGGLLYLLAAERLCRRACEGTTRYLLGLLGLSVSPFMLDYLVAARGYGLALAFFTWALVVSWRWLELDRAGRDRLRRWLLPLISVLTALSVASNLAFAFVDTALLLTVWGSGMFAGTRATWRARLEETLALSIPGGVLYLLLVPGILSFDRGILFVGAQSWAATWRSLIEALFGGLGATGLDPLVHGTLEGAVELILLLCAGLVAGTLLLRLASRDGGDPTVQRSRPGNGAIFVATASILAGTVLLHSVAHAAAGVLLPMERTAIFLVPLTFLVILLVPGSLPAGRFRAATGSFVTTAFGLFVLLFVCFGHIRYFEQWRYDADSREVFLSVRALARANPGSSIGIDWLFEPSLNFYRSYFHAASLPRFVRKPPTIDDSIFALLPARDPTDRRLLRSLRLRIVLADPLSGAVVAVKPPARGSPPATTEDAAPSGSGG